jgi:hypothetical protein
MQPVNPPSLGHLGVALPLVFTKTTFTSLYQHYLTHIEGGAVGVTQYFNIQITKTRADIFGLTFVGPQNRNVEPLSIPDIHTRTHGNRISIK